MYGYACIWCASWLVSLEFYNFLERGSWCCFSRLTFCYKVNTHCKQANIQPLLKENLDPLFPIDYRFIPMLLFLSKPLENVTTWQHVRCVAKYQYSQSTPICNSLFIYFQQPATAQGLNQRQMPSPTITPSFIGVQQKLMIDLKIIDDLMYLYSTIRNLFVRKLWTISRSKGDIPQSPGSRMWKQK